MMSRSVDGSVTRPSALACTECRKRHLKCDAARPVCTRCVAESIECKYTPSRRGYRGNARKCGRTRSANGSVITLSEQRSSMAEGPLSPEILGSDFLAMETDLNDNGYPMAEAERDVASLEPWDSDYASNGPVNAGPTSLTTTQPEMVVESASGIAELADPIHDHLLEFYYSKFHNGHPIVVPRTLYSTLPLPKSLRSVVLFIGSHFSASVSTDAFRKVAADALAADTSRSGYLVQALLLFSIGLHARNKQAEARATLDRAIDLAVEIGMNKRKFATANGEQMPSLEESWRRTWWELLVVDCMLAAVERRPWCKTNSVALGTLLPCEDNLFMDGACASNPPSLDQLENRLFAAEEVQFSSYCYRIEAARLLARTLPVSDNCDAHQDDVAAVDNALAGWAYHLPASKADIVNNTGELDELMFQAHLIIYSATIRLHLPRSNLRSSALPWENGTAFAPRTRDLAPATSRHDHAIKATAASKGLSDLAALRTPVQEHTPFFACTIVLGAVVQLSVCAMHASYCISQHRERIALIFGVLKSMGLVWPLAKLMLGQIKTVAASVLQKPVRAESETRACSSVEKLGTSFHPTPDDSWMQNLLGGDFQSPAPINFDLMSPTAIP